MTEPHRRVIIWHDPRAHLARVEEMSGIEFLQAIVDGELPQAPIAEAMGFRLAEVAAGRAVFVGTPEGHMMNPMGAIHGGYFGALLDSAMGCAVGTLCAAGQGYTTLEYKINLVRGMTPETGEVRTEGWVVHGGRRTATAEGRITDAAGRLIGHGSTTCIILS